MQTRYNNQAKIPYARIYVLECHYASLPFPSSHITSTLFTGVVTLQVKFIG